MIHNLLFVHAGVSNGEETKLLKPFGVNVDCRRLQSWAFGGCGRWIVAGEEEGRQLFDRERKKPFGVNVDLLLFIPLFGGCEELHFTKYVSTNY